jgi:peroxiredoxin
MSMADHVLQPGEAAPDFTLPAVNRNGEVSLSDYRGKGAVYVGLFRGLHCPFCRRQIAALAGMREKLAPQGVEVIAVVNTPAERARQYFQYRPTPVVLAADPDVQTHRAFGLGETRVLPDDTDERNLHWPETTSVAYLMKATSIDANGELPAPVNVFAAGQALNEKDGFEMTPADEASAHAHATQGVGHFLIDAGGTIRWSFVDAPDHPNQMARMPDAEEVLAAARQLPH